MSLLSFSYFGMCSHLHKNVLRDKCTFAVCSSRCGLRTGGRSFVKVSGAPRSPETTVWRRRPITARRDRRTSGQKTNRTPLHHTWTATSLLVAVPLLIPLLVWRKVRMFALLLFLQTLMFPVAPSAFTLLHFSPS